MAAAETPTVLEAVRALAPQIRSQIQHMEADRRLPPKLVQAMAEIGLFRLMIPKSLGGLEIDLVPALHIFEAVSQSDGSAGWCAMIGATGGTTRAFLTEAVAREIYASNPNVVTAGAIAPHGTAQPDVPGCRHWGDLGQQSAPALFSRRPYDHPARRCGFTDFRSGGENLVRAQNRISDAVEVNLQRARFRDRAFIQRFQPCKLQATLSICMVFCQEKLPRKSQTVCSTFPQLPSSGHASVGRRHWLMRLSGLCPRRAIWIWKSPQT